MSSSGYPALTLLDVWAERSHFFVRGSACFHCHSSLLSYFLTILSRAAISSCNIVSLRRVNESQVVTRSLAMRGRFGHASVHTPPPHIRCSATTRLAFENEPVTQHYARSGSERDLPDPARVAYAAAERGYRPCGRRDRFQSPRPGSRVRPTRSPSPDS
jgi:hypothetical protein